MKKMRVVFAQSETDKKLLEASLKALNSEVLAARFEHTVEYDSVTEKTTLWFWRKPTGGWNEKQGD